MTGQLEKGSQVNFALSFTHQVEHIKRAFVMLKCGTPQLKHFESKGDGVFECEAADIPGDCTGVMIGVELKNSSKATLVIYDTK